jgi:Tat protein secretion system quality control protein TatD with DNase activity
MGSRSIKVGTLADPHYCNYCLFVVVLDDFEAMLERSRNAGVKTMIITGTSLKESNKALRLAKDHGEPSCIGSFIPANI